MTAVEMQSARQNVNLNYFVCTLGEAAEINTQNPRSWRTVNDFIDHQAEKFPKRPAVGFPISSHATKKDSGWGFVVYSMEISKLHYPYSTDP